MRLRFSNIPFSLIDHNNLTLVNYQLYTSCFFLLSVFFKHKIYIANVCFFFNIKGLHNHNWFMSLVFFFLFSFFNPPCPTAPCTSKRKDRSLQKGMRERDFSHYTAYSSQCFFFFYRPQLKNWKKNWTKKLKKKPPKTKHKKKNKHQQGTMHHQNWYYYSLVFL